ncbi:MAG TPA: FAD-binding oxidoreductase [Planctomycetota bacterium]|nr:FAD-binding oxidoreductase [Planctomycetota bacterium]
MQGDPAVDVRRDRGAAGAVTPEDVVALLDEARRLGAAVRTDVFPFGEPPLAKVDRPVRRIDVRTCAGVLDHSPADLTVTALAGTTLRELQSALASAGQWLAVDPPEDLTLGQIVARNEWGARRTGYGTVRDHLLGLRFALADGRTLRTGGRIVKSATGYDLHRLQVGAMETLGVALEATFRLRPRPPAAATVAIERHSLADAHAAAMSIRALPDAPAALAVFAAPGAPARCVARYEGHAAEVERAARSAGGSPVPDLLLPRDADGALVLRVACRPSKLLASIDAAARALGEPASRLAIRAHPSIAIADVARPLRDGEDPLATLRDAAGAIPAGSVRLRRPFEDARPIRDPLAERVKRLFDPEGRLNPGVLLFASAS